MFSHHGLKSTSFQISVPSISKKGNSHWAIVKPSDGLSIDGVILLRGNIHTALRTQELLQNFKWEVWSHTLYCPDLAPNQGSELFSGTTFSSNSDVKTVSENLLNGKGHDFYEAG
ncbi:hypothetical protein AVEN_261956-1 [Araneus ventricosus]|uniref:Uncharacterized protein n=1 Tax=Araneus ventricosus TaxID=182803 RepID=A0A4Y2ESI7_ARAVE|nr:hypothetical protein AVEN_261956-1 [Araneus ventricosus]